VYRLLIEAGADVNACDMDGWTPIHAAAHWGQDEACKLLAEHLANISAIDHVVLTLHCSTVVTCVWSADSQVQVRVHCPQVRGHSESSPWSFRVRV